MVGVRLITGYPNKQADWGQRSWYGVGGLVVPSEGLMVVMIQIRVMAIKTVKETQSQTEVKAVRIDFIQ